MEQWRGICENAPMRSIVPLFYCSFAFTLPGFPGPFIFRALDYWSIGSMGQCGLLTSLACRINEEGSSDNQALTATASRGTKYIIVPRDRPTRRQDLGVGGGHLGHILCGSIRSAGVQEL